MDLKKSQIVVNDVFDELKVENIRLFNELLFADKCLKVLFEFKSFVELNSKQFKLNLEENNKQLYEELSEKVKQVLDETKFNVNKEDNSFDFNERKKTSKKRPKNKINNVKIMSKNTISVEQRPASTQRSGSGDKIYSVGNNNGIESNTSPKNNIVSPDPKCGQQSDTTLGLPNDCTLVCSYPGCGKSFKHKDYLADHTRTRHSGEKPFECHLCRKAFPSKTHRNNHMTIVHKAFDEPIICGIDGCEKRFKNDFYLKTHQNYYHIFKDRFVCDHPNCDYKTGKQRFLNNHKISSHTTETPFKCQFEGCDKAFKLEDSYNYHRNSHSNTILKCTKEGCDRTFHNIRTMTLHVRYDHSDTWYSCDWPGCEYRNKRKECISRHMAKHGAEHIACIWPNCDRMFKTKNNMKRHLLTHKQEKRHVCHWPGCQYRCIIPGNLKSHMKNNHKDIQSPV